MFLEESRSLLGRKPDLKREITALDSLLHEAVRSGSAVRLSVPYVVSQTRVEPHFARVLLNDYCQTGLLRLVMVPQCPRFHAGIRDYASEAEIPVEIPCDLCTGNHSRLEVDCCAVFVVARRIDIGVGSEPWFDRDRPVPRFSWLHLSDLHRGMNGAAHLWPLAEDVVYRDMERLHARTGPWDAVFFTGDLTQTGSPEQFDRLEEDLENLWCHLRALGSDPVLLCVPGNHDLQRPSSLDPVALVLDKWQEHPEVQQAFWTGGGNQYRDLIAQVFGPYLAWQEVYQRGEIKDLRHGLVPGDFSCVVEKPGLRMGVVGLNSSFLHLRDNAPGSLCLDLRQLDAVCHGHLPQWCRMNHVNILMTHHGPQWLTSQSQEALKEAITPARFAVHLYGHMHEGALTGVACNGAAPGFEYQGSSLFGLERCKGGAVDRRHGYAAGRVELHQGAVRLRMWPRKSVKRPTGRWAMVPDVEAFELLEDEGTAAEVVGFSPRVAA